MPQGNGGCFRKFQMSDGKISVGKQCFFHRMQFDVRESGEPFEDFEGRGHVCELFLPGWFRIDVEECLRDCFFLIFRADCVDARFRPEDCRDGSVLFDERYPLFRSGTFQMAGNFFCFRSESAR